MERLEEERDFLYGIHCFKLGKAHGRVHNEVVSVGIIEEISV